MQEIHVSHVEGAEAVLASLRDPQVVLEKVARQVADVPPLAERLRVMAAARAERPVRDGAQAVLMLGSVCVERETRALAGDWLRAMEEGVARVVRDTAETSAVRPEPPAHLQHWRQTLRHRRGA